MNQKMCCALLLWSLSTFWWLLSTHICFLWNTLFAGQALLCEICLVFHILFFRMPQLPEEPRTSPFLDSYFIQWSEQVFAAQFSVK